MTRNNQNYITCVFCKGTGRDTFGLLSAMSCCSVCGGVGEVRVMRPRVACAFCKGSGVQPGSRLNCSGCRGTGAHTVSKPQAKCPVCSGVGRSSGSLNLPCTKCSGAGVVRTAHVTDSH